MITRKGLTVMVLVFAVLAYASFSRAGADVVNIVGVGFSVDATIKDNLEALTGKRVSLVLVSGKVVVGRVKAVGDHLVHVEKLEQRDFFDALVRIDQISAIDTRFRKLAR